MKNKELLNLINGNETIPNRQITKCAEDLAYNQFFDNEKLQDLKTDIVTEMLKIQKPTAGKAIFASFVFQLKDYWDSEEVDDSNHTIKGRFSLRNFFYDMSLDSDQIHKDLRGIYQILGKRNDNISLCRLVAYDLLSPFVEAYVKRLFPDCKVYTPGSNELCVDFTFNPKKVLKETQQQYKDDTRENKAQERKIDY